MRGGGRRNGDGQNSMSSCRSQNGLAREFL
jgi:hypothetical protein